MKKITKNLISFFLLSIILYTNIIVPVVATNNKVHRPKNQIFSTNDLSNLNIFYINDLHGWLEPHDGYGGTATLFSQFKKYGYENTTSDDNLFLLGGDYNTGPGISTVSKGEAVVETLNAMGLDATAIGNHEFDFGLEILQQQVINASFRLLSANIYDTGTNHLASFTTPYKLQNVAGTTVGILGLTTISTKTSVIPDTVGQLDFGLYEDALRIYVPEMRQKGAQMIIVLAHVSGFELAKLSSDVADLKIPLFLGGHSHTGYNQRVGESLIYSVEALNRQFGKLTLKINTTSNTTTIISVETIENIFGKVTPEPVLESITHTWNAKLNLDQYLTKTSVDIYDTDDEISLGGLISYSFLFYFNFTHNFALSPRGGGLRDYFRQGNITLNDVISVMPFEDYLFEFSISGFDLLSELQTSMNGNIISGIKNINKEFQIFDSDSFSPINPEKIYAGIMLDYTYIGRNYIYEYNSTYIHYRSPLVAYLKTLDTIQDHRAIFPHETLPSSSSSIGQSSFNVNTSIVSTSIDNNVETSSFLDLMVFSLACASLLRNRRRVK